MYHYQDTLGAWVKEKKPRLIVETGVYQGCSTREILKNIPETGRLHSIEPNPLWQHYQDFKDNHRWVLWTGVSIYCLPLLFKTTGPWDVFLHDSDHDPECQTFEYELAYQCVKPGGYIISDDFTWGLPPHGAWKTFVEKYSLTELPLIGSCAIIQKPFDAKVITSNEVEEVVRYAHECSIKAAVANNQATRYFL